MTNCCETLESRNLFAATALPTVRFRSDTPNDTVKASDLLVDHSGRSYVVATTSADVQVVRLGSSGKVDASYAKSNGTLKLPADLATVRSGKDRLTTVLDPADRLYVLVDNKVYRFTTAGRTDDTFGTHGVVDLSSQMTNSKGLTVDASNRIYVAGAASHGKHRYSLRVLGLRSNGLVNHAFADKGT